MAKLLPIIIIVVGVLAGAGIGFVMKPAEETEHAEDASADDHGDGHGEAKKDDGHGDKKKDDHGKKADKKKKKKDSHGGGHGKKSDSPSAEYLEFRRQFIVPVVRENGVKAMLVLDLSLEMEPGTSSGAYSYEPKLRAALLETLFALSHTGLFSGEITAPEVTEVMEERLLITSRSVIGDKAKHVLTLGIVRQDL